jgi:hypothetical protein
MHPLRCRSDTRTSRPDYLGREVARLNFAAAEHGHHNPLCAGAMPRVAG